MSQKRYRPRSSFHAQGFFCVKSRLLHRNCIRERGGDFLPLAPKSPFRILFVEVGSSRPLSPFFFLFPSHPPAVALQKRYLNPFSLPPSPPPAMCRTGSVTYTSYSSWELRVFLTVHLATMSEFNCEFNDLHVVRL